VDAPAIRISARPPFVTDADAGLRSLRTAAEQSGVAIDEFVFPTDVQAILGTLRFHYLDWGGSGERTIVFLHGFALNAHTWDLVCLSLRPDYRCIALDLRGHGDSEWSPGLHYDLPSLAEDVGHLLDALDVDRPILVGMSMGGMTALRFAADHSDRLAGLVVIEAGAVPRDDGLRRLRGFMAAEHEHDSIEDFVNQAVSFNSRRDPELLRMSLRHNLRQLWNGRWTWKYDRRHLGVVPGDQHVRAMEALAAESPAIVCPTLIVRGSESDLFSVEDAESVTRRIPSARWVTVTRAGHNVQGDNPGGLVEVLGEFLSEIGADS
jgi:pimeloyl-ACP methyl ester carboxylesterase